MSKGRILIIEEQRNVADELTLYFTQQGYEVNLARSQNEALVLPRKLMPLLILLSTSTSIESDEVDPIIVGLRHTTRTSHIPILLLIRGEGPGMKLQMVKHLEDLGVDYVYKPLQLAEVFLRAQRLIEQLDHNWQVGIIDGLPDRRLLHDMIRIAIRDAEHSPWTLFDLKIQYLDLLAQQYGQIAKTEIFRFFALLLGEVLEEFGTSDDFVGQEDNNFWIVTFISSVQMIHNRLAERFEKEIQPHTSAKNISPDIPLKLIIGIVSSTEQQFSTVDEVVQLAIKRRDEAAQSP
jgi:DNA-binding response OmpR family regulator